MSALTLGLGIDFERDHNASGSIGPLKRAITSIWPAAAIESAATEHNKAPREQLRQAVCFSQKFLWHFHSNALQTIFSDAILAMLAATATEVNGQLFTDEDFLRDTVGVDDFSGYSVVPGTAPRRYVFIFCKRPLDLSC